MRLGPYRLAPPRWALALCAIGVLLFVSLGLWQLDRAEGKRELAARQQTMTARGMGEITAPEAARERRDSRPVFEHGRVFAVTGRYDASRQILLADQVNGTRTGFRVWTPLVLDNGIRVMIDRGWVERGDADSGLPNPGAPAGKVRLTGYWTGFEQPAFGSGPANCLERGWPRVLSYPDAADVDCQYDAPVLDGLLLLDADIAGGFERDWAQERDTVGLPAYGHLIYAGQWFAMAAIAIGILVFVNLKRR